MSPRRFALLALLAVSTGGATACGADEPRPAWIRLARSLRPPPVPDARIELDAERGIALVPGPDGLRLEGQLRREDWTLRPNFGFWEARSPIRSLAEGDPPFELTSAEGRAFRYVLVGPQGSGRDFAPGDFSSQRDMVLLLLEEGERPPELATLSSSVSPGRAHGQAWRIEGPRLSGDGLVLWPGQVASHTLDLPPRARLSFALGLEQLAHDVDQAAPTRFEVTLDGETIFQHELTPRGGSASSWHAVDLPTEGRQAARLGFAVTGAPAYASFLAPVIGPRDVGTPASRPWGEGPPDLVVFLADTFRADNLGDCDPDLSLTPNLQRLSEEGLFFPRAWSVSTYTLPAHASMFSGLYPRQAGVEGFSTALSEEVVTIAELLAARGYRCGAVTDSVIVSQAFNMDQGFEWFDEHNSTLESTLERARGFLEADDGRPVFLFVQTYRTHRPYLVSEATRGDYGACLNVSRSSKELDLEWVRLTKNYVLDKTSEALSPDLLAETRDHYRGGAVDLDRGLGRFHGDLQARGLLDRGYLVFTSDHGEGFLEHDVMGHGGAGWEEVARVPLLILGGTVEPRRVPHAASLIDIAPTLARLGGLPPPPDWRGTSLLELDRERTLFVFQCDAKLERSAIAILSGDKKLLVRGDLETPVGAYDLRVDPGERRDLLADEPGWERELLERHRDELAELLRPVYAETAARVSPELRAELEAMGYAGD